MGMPVMLVMFMMLMSAVLQYLFIFNSDLVLFIETAHRNTPSAPGGQFLFHFAHASDDGSYKYSASEIIQQFILKAAQAAAYDTNSAAAVFHLTRSASAAVLKRAYYSDLWKSGPILL